MHLCLSIHLSSLNAHAQIIYNMDTQTIQYVWSVSMTSDPNACAVILAHSTMRFPRGAFGTPPMDDYPEQLRRLLVPHATAPLDGHVMVRYYPLTVMPESTYTLYPAIGPDGNLRMRELAPPDTRDAEASAVVDGGDLPDLQEATRGPRTMLPRRAFAHGSRP